MKPYQKDECTLICKGTTSSSTGGFQLLLAVLILQAHTQYREGAFPTLQRTVAKSHGIKTVFADAGDNAGTPGQARRIQAELGPKVEMVRHPANRATESLLQVDMEFPNLPKRGLTVLPKRWVVNTCLEWEMLTYCQRLRSAYGGDRSLDLAARSQAPHQGITNL